MTFRFDPKTVEPNQQFEPIPPGWYVVRCVTAQMTQTGAGDAMLKLTFEVDHAAHNGQGGRKLWWNLTVGHSKDQPREIAQRNLSAICRAIGLLEEFDDTQLDRLCGHLLELKVEVRHDSDRGPQNDVKAAREFVPGRDRDKPAPKMSFKAKPAKATKPAVGEQLGTGPDYDQIPF